MAFSIRAGMTFTTPAGTTSSITATYSTDALDEYDITVPATTTDLSAQISFPYANIKAILFASDVPVTIETNNASTPTDTVTLTSTVLAKMWTHDGKAGNLAANPLTANVTAVYITNAGAAAANVKIRVAYDATP
jgi:hypothetical protein